MLVKFVEERKELWDSYLDTCVFAYNTSRRESTHCTPFEVMFGRKAVLPIDIEMRKNTAEDVLALCHDDSDVLADNMDRLMENRRNLLEDAKANIKRAQERQKEQYDRKHAFSDAFQCGAKVLMKDLQRKKRKGGKLDVKWLGPYTITKNLGKGLYSLQLVSDSNSTVGRINGAHLKPYNTPPLSRSPSPPSRSPTPPSRSPTPPSRSPTPPSRSPPPPSHSPSPSRSPTPPSRSPTPPSRSPTPPSHSPSPSCSPSLDYPILNTTYVLPYEPLEDESIPPLPPPFVPNTSLHQSAPDPLPPHPSPPNTSPLHCSSPKAKKPKLAKSRVNYKAQTVMEKWRQSTRKHAKKHTVTQSAIDVDALKTPPPQPKPAMWIDSGIIKLTDDDREILESPTEWLNSNIINAAQTILHEQFGLPGLQDSELGSVFAFSVETDEFVQILYGAGHWLTVSTIGTEQPNVFVYDSLYSSPPVVVKQQIAALLATRKPAIPLKYVDVQMQSGANDCGLFAIAFATALCSGELPGKYSMCLNREL